MYQGRFFVTIVLVLGTLAYGACSPKKENTQAKLVREGSQKLTQSSETEIDLQKYHILIPPPKGKRALAYNWLRLNRTERHDAREKLARYVALTSRVQEIDTTRGLYIENKALFLLQAESALEYQRGLENFERIHGENYEPKNPKEQPLFIDLRDA